MKLNINHYMLAVITAILLLLNGCGAQSPMGTNGGGGAVSAAKATPAPMNATSEAPKTLAPHAPNQVLAKIKDLASAQQVASDVGGSITGTINSLNVVQINLNGLSVANAVAKLHSNPNVIYAEPNYTVKAFMVPNDTLYNQQWGPQKIGTETAWNTTQGTGITIAVVDTGVDGTHPDLSGQLVAGYDYINNLALTETENSDDMGHGSHVSGTIAAKINNALGVAGVAPAAKIMPVKVLGQLGGTNFSVAQGITYATANGAKVINMSLGGQGYSQVLQDAVTKAYQAGIAVVVAMGNDGQSVLSYPAACQGVIAVGATDPYDTKTSFSTTGNHISVAAPGTGILSSVPAIISTSGYASWDGTSMATPHVAGVAALVIATHPGITPSQMKSQLEATASHPGSFNINDGYGRVNAAAAIGALSANKYGDITVTVATAAGGTVAGANVLLRTPSGDYTTVSDVNGKAYLLDIPAGAGYTLYVNGVGATAAQNQAVTVTAGANTNVTYTFTSSTAGKLYLGGSGTVDVMDLATNASVAAIPSGVSVGVAVNPAANKLYLANYWNNRLDIVDTITYTKTTSIPVGTAPYKVALNTAANLAYVSNMTSNNVSVINLSTNTVVATIPVGTAPGGITINPAANRAYVANWTSNNVSVIDTTTNTVVATIAVGVNPIAVAVHPAANKLFVSNCNSKTISVVDTTTNTVVATITPVGGTTLSGITVNPATNTAYIYSPGGNTVSVINTTTNAISATIVVPVDTTTFAGSDLVLNAATSKLYVPNGGNRTISIINTATNTVLLTTGTFTAVDGMAIAP